MTNSKKSIDIEFILAQKIKKNYCNELGKEKEPAKAAEIIHEIGVIYRKRSPDKIALLKSVGLFNAAIVRNPSNIARIKFDLCEICQHILQIAGANHQNISLVKIAELVKIQVENLRTSINAYLKDERMDLSSVPTSNDFQKMMSQKISAFRTINKIIANKYKQIMANISQFCEDVMGEPPCKYAVVGMGSLARDEITPYSDFEHIILLFDDKNYTLYLDFFRWFSVIFHVIVLNLQETIIPSLDIKKLNDDKNCKLGSCFYDAVTPRGISFDGMMPHACKFPLGRTQHTKNKPFKIELIKPVSEMLQFLSSEADLKNGYHLSDMLTKTCFVFGNKNIFEQFVDGIHNCISKQSNSKNLASIKKQVKDDLRKFSTRFQLTKLQSQDKINIKQFVYRSTTIFISALGRICNISANSSFDIIDQMEIHNRISKNTAKKLRYAIAIASEIRLKVYMKSKCQNDYAIELTQNDGMEQFLSIAGAANTINYFQIAYCLQFEVAKQLRITKLPFYSDPYLVNIAISLAFGMHNLIDVSIHLKTSNEFNFDTCIGQLESVVNWKLSTFKPTTSSFTLKNEQIRNIAHHLYSVRIFDEALEFYEKFLNLFDYKPKVCSSDNFIAQSDLKHVKHRNVVHDITNKKEFDVQTLYNIGYCHCHFGNYTDALMFLNRALEIQESTTMNDSKDRNILKLLSTIGNCQMDLGNYTDALNFLNRALEIQQNTTLNASKDKYIAMILHNIGRCHMDLNNYTDALTFLNRALEIQPSTMLNDNKDKNISNALNNIGICHIRLSNYTDALIFFNRALEIHQNTTLNDSEDRNIAMTLSNIGLCHKDFGNYADALTFLNRSLEIQQNTTLNDCEDKNIANTLKNIGSCHYHLNNYTDALTFLNCALEIQQNTTPNDKEIENIAVTLNIIGLCYKGLGNYIDALSCLNRSFEIQQNTTLNNNKDRNIATTMNNIALCHMGMGNYIDALTFLHGSLEIQQNTTLNDSEHKHIATTFNNIALCHKVLGNYTDALKFLHCKLEIQQNILLNDSELKKIVTTLHNIGSCLVELCNYTDALTFLNRALEIQQNTLLNDSEDRCIATTLNNIGFCHIHLCNYTDALISLNRALKIQQNTMLINREDKYIATTIDNIALCHIHLSNSPND